MENVYTKARPKHSGSKQLFENPVLEKLSRTHISVPITIFLSISAGLLFYAFKHTALPAYLIPLVFMAGTLLFSFLEYLVHRYLFHMSTHTEGRKRMQYICHGVHHEYPKDKTRLAMPPLASIFLATAFFALYYLVMDTWVFAFLPGFLTGYAAYLFVHFIVHAYPPPKNVFKALWLNHSIHHYKDQEIAFGVSSPLWDYVFGTMPEKKPK
ncbi:sterol desaturase family protein [Cytophagaceae bacterium ABcell3]|nr:sterol desaturase family protein [Cytophagaceae bacterium ABcell3]